MVVVIISWIYYLILCMTIGLGIEKSLKKLLWREWRFQTIDYLVAGIAGITVYAAFFSIFYKVGMIAHILLLTAALICGWRNKEEIKLWLKNHKKILFSWEGFFYLGVILFIAFFTSRGNFHTDTNIYHAQNIRLYEEYGLIKGMGNLQLHYGYNSLYLAFVSILSLGWLLPWSLHTTTGFIEVALCLYAMHHLKSFWKRKSHLEDAGCIAILLYALTNVTGNISPATDYPTMFLSIYMAAVWLRLSEKKSYYHEYALLAVFAVFLGTYKLSAIAMAVVVVYPAYFLLKERKVREILIYIGMGIVVLAPYLIRNILITGWLIYPFEAIDLFQVDWKIPLEYLLVDSYQIKVWARCLYDINLIDLTIKEWLPIWWENHLHHAQLLMGANILAIMLWLWNLGYKIIKKIEIHMEVEVLYFGLLASAFLWFCLAPFIRYGLAFLLLLPLLGIVEWMGYQKRGLQSIITGILVVGITYCFMPYIDVYMMDMLRFVKNNIREPYYIYARDYDDGNTGSVEINGNTIYYNDYIKEEGERNSYFYYPNTAYYFMLERSTLAGDEIEDGFIPK